MILLLGIVASSYVLAVAVGFYGVSLALDYEPISDFVPEGWDTDE